MIGLEVLAVVVIVSLFGYAIYKEVSKPKIQQTQKSIEDLEQQTQEFYKLKQTIKNKKQK